MKRFLRFLIRVVFNVLLKVEISGKEKVPATGGLVVAANHIGLADILMVYYATERLDLFIPVGEKWEKVRILKWMGKYLDFIFVDRYNPDLKALRQMIKLMNEGKCLVIAPEGTRSKTGALIQAHPGVAYLAAKEGFPIVPVAITGTRDEVVFPNIRHFKRSRVTLTGGDPFTLPPLPHENREEALKEYTDEVMCRIAALLPEEMRGFYAEHPRLKELLGK